MLFNRVLSYGAAQPCIRAQPRPATQVRDEGVEELLVLDLAVEVAADQVAVPIVRNVCQNVIPFFMC